MNDEGSMENCRLAGKGGDHLILIEDSEIIYPVPMVPVPGCIGITVTGVELSDSGVVEGLRGVWRANFGTAAACVGDVVLELVAPGSENSRTRRAALTSAAGSTSQARGQELARSTINLLVAGATAAAVASAPLSRRSTSVRATAPKGGSGWLWLGSWPSLGADWPFLVGPLTFIAWQQQQSVRKIHGIR